MIGSVVRSSRGCACRRGGTRSLPSGRRDEPATAVGPRHGTLRLFPVAGSGRRGKNRAGTIRSPGKEPPMPELRGADLVTEYLVREKVPYLFGYAGHGAVGLLDGVFDRQDELKVDLPAHRDGGRLHGRRVLPRQPRGDPRLHVHRARADAAHGRDRERLLRLLRDDRDHRPGRDDAERLGRAPGGVPLLPGRLPEHGEGDHEAQLPGALGRGPRQVPAEGVQARPHRPSRPRAPRRPVRPVGDEGRRRGARARGALADAQLAHARLARGGREGARAAARRHGGR